MTKAKPGLLSRDAILAIKDTKYEDVPVPEWGGTVRIKALSGSERDQFEASIVGTGGGRARQRNMINIRARLVALTIVDENMQTMFTPGDVDELGTKSASALDRCFAVAQRLAGITDADVEELDGNFS